MDFLPVIPCIYTFKIIPEIRLIDPNGFGQFTVNLIAINELDFILLDRITKAVHSRLSLGVIVFGTGEIKPRRRQVIGLGIQCSRHIVLAFG